MKDKVKNITLLKSEMKVETLLLIWQKSKVLWEYYEQLYANKLDNRWNGQISRNIKPTKSKSQRNRKSE